MKMIMFGIYFTGYSKLDVPFNWTFVSSILSWSLRINELNLRERNEWKTKSTWALFWTHVKVLSSISCAGSSFAFLLLRWKACERKLLPIIFHPHFSVTKSVAVLKSSLCYYYTKRFNAIAQVQHEFNALLCAVMFHNTIGLHNHLREKWKISYTHTV